MSLIKLSWTHRALLEYADLLDYLMETWGAAITRRVVTEIDHQIIRIQNTPEQFAILVKNKNLRRYVVSPQTSIFFRFSENTIEIYSIFDNRQNPKKRL